MSFYSSQNNYKDSNPFQFETENKKFLQNLELLADIAKQREKEENEISEEKTDDCHRLTYGKKGLKNYGLMRQIAEEGQQLADYREEILQKDQAVMQKRKQRANSMKLWNDKEYDRLKQTYKIKNIIKESRETTQEFITKKRQIFLTNMNINNKQNETKKLKEFMENEKQSLAQRKQYFDNDKDLVDKFIEEVQSQAKKIEEEADIEQKQNEVLKSELQKLINKSNQNQNQIEQKREELNILLNYKNFINKMKAHKLYKIFIEIKILELKKKQQKQKKSQNTFLITGVDPEKQQQENDFKIELEEFYPEFLIEQKQRIEDENIKSMIEKNINEDLLSEQKRILKQAKIENNLVKKEIKQKLNDLDRQRKELQIQYQKIQNNEIRVKQQVTFEKNQYQTDIQEINSDEHQINYQKIGQGISEVFKNIENIDLVSQLTPNQQIFQIEQTMDKLHKHMEKAKIEYPDEYRISDRQVKEDAAKKVRDQKKQEEEEEKKKNFKIKQKKREDAVNNLRKGKKIMQKQVLVQKQQVQQEIDQVQNDDGKYLQENFFI